MANKVKQIFRIVEFRNQVNVTAQFVLRGQLIQVVQHAEILQRKTNRVKHSDLCIRVAA